MIYCTEPYRSNLTKLLQRYALNLVLCENDQPIPGSFWGDSEAGLIDNKLYIRQDTPLHSALHEACHYVCMDATRRSALDTNAAGDYDEENAVCYLQCLLADQLDGVDRFMLFKDMDAWGYSFRLGCTQRWFEQDAEDAHRWLLSRRLITPDSVPTFLLHDVN